MENPTPAPFQGSQSIQALQRLLVAGPPQEAAIERIIADLESERHLEHAWLILKQARLDPALWGGLQGRLKAAMAQSRARRMSQWQTDPNRKTLRLQFEVRSPACAQHPAGLVGLLARTLIEAGLPLAMGLEKSPRPAVHLGHPLPPLVEGWGEWADAVLLEAAGTPPPELPQRINPHAAPGLRVRQCLLVPNYASPVSELCRGALWRWSCPAGLLEPARERMAAFIGAERFEMERTGKIGGQKSAKRVDIRPLLEECRWEGQDLWFRTRLAPGEAANPRKLLAAILGLEPAAIEALVRTQVDLVEDPRLLQADKFEPKLHNMFEDAVLLDFGGNILVVDDDDDDAIVLG